jgi:hypothetical protein
MSPVAERMMVLFRGSDRAHGTHGRPTPEGVKASIKSSAQTILRPPTIELWEAHLRGERPLGVIPICADGRCWWGPIDVDKYDIDVIGLVRRVEGTVLVPCRSKSGGLHLFLFLAEAQPADKVSALLTVMAARQGGWLAPRYSPSSTARRRKRRSATGW